jgi:hypothetical protein
MIATYAMAGAFQIASVAGFFQDDFSTCRAIPAAAQNSPPSARPRLADLSNFAQTQTVCERNLGSKSPFQSGNGKATKIS